MKESMAILAHGQAAARIANVARQVNPALRVEVVSTAEDLMALEPTLGPDWLLVSFGTGVIVSAEALSRVDGSAVNFHAASPDYPGRDPHHFAVYDGVRRYGATAHMMVSAVDSGPILAVEWFDVSPGIGAKELLERANAAAMRLIETLVPRLVAGKRVPPLDVAWGCRKSTRRDFLALCRVGPDTATEEFHRRLRATAFGDRRNLYTDFHGQRFRLEGPVPQDEAARISSRWSEFTEEGYRRLLELARARYRFATFGERGKDRHVLWRHDVDLSVHRALRLAEIEQEHGLVATYFFMLRSTFYNLAEPEVLDRARRIADLGHSVGLHFQTDAWPNESWTVPTLEQRVAEERDRLASLLDRTLDAVSFHDPDSVGLSTFEPLIVGGLVNAYGRDLREEYGYCSDSNGHWRFDPIRAVLEDGGYERLQVLTHPAWWTPEPMPPRARVERCVTGRAAAAMRRYDEALRQAGRCNLA